MKSEDIFIGLGSNRGSREENINRALELIDSHPSIELLNRSDVIETEPWGVDHDRDFLNCVIKCRTNLKPLELLEALQQIETELGRGSRGQNRPRVMDLDILYFGEKTIRNSDLQIPHPDLHKRKFVLRSLCELAPDFVHPELEETNKSLLEQINNSSR